MPFFIAITTMELLNIAMISAMFFSGWTSVLITIFQAAQIAFMVVLSAFIIANRKKDLDEILESPIILFGYLISRFTLFAWAIVILFSSITFAFMPHPVKIISHTCVWMQAIFFLVIFVSVITTFCEKRHYQEL